MKQIPTDQNVIAHIKRNAAAHGLTSEARTRIESRLRMAVGSVTAADADRFRQQSGFFLKHKPMLISILIALVLLGSGTGTVLASNNAKPGDFLFGVDQAVERVRYSLTVSQEAKARLAAEIAAERAKELAELTRAQSLAKASKIDAENNNTNNAALELTHTDTEDSPLLDEQKPVQNAVDVVNASKPDISETLDPSNADSVVHLEVEVHIRDNSSVVNAEYNDQHYNFVLRTIDKQELIEGIAQHLQVSEALVASVITFETEEDEDVSNDDSILPTKNSNSSNNNVNGDNANGNTNSSASSDDNESTWRIEVRVRDGSAEIKARQGEAIRHEWTSSNTSVNTLAAEIAARINLSPEQVQSIWDLEIENS